MTDLNNFFRALKSHIQLIRQQHARAHILMIGDFNARMGSQTLDNNTSLAVNGKFLAATMKRNKFHIMNRKFCPGVPTFKNHSGQSIIDLTLTNHPGLIQHMHIDNHHTFSTDHRPVYTTLSLTHFPKQHLNIYGIRTAPSNNPELIKMAQIQADKRLTYLRKCQFAMMSNCSQAEYDKCSHIITVLTMYTMHAQLITSNGLSLRQNSSKWHATSPEIVDVNTRLQFPHSAKNNHQKLMGEFHRLRHGIIHATNLAKSTDLNNKQYGQKLKSMKQQYRELNNNTTTATLTHNNQIMPQYQALHQFYQAQMTKPMPDHPDINQTNQQVLNASANRVRFQTKQVTEAIFNMNARACPGYDGINAIHLKQLNPLLFPPHVQFVETNSTPSHPLQKFGAIRGLKKKAQCEEPADFRPISLLPIWFKVYERLILQIFWRLGTDKKLHRLQGSIQRARGVLEQLHLAQVLSENQTITTHQPLFAGLLDIKKAYDTVWRESVIHKLHHQFQVLLHICRVIKKHLREHVLRHKRPPPCAIPFPHNHRSHARIRSQPLAIRSFHQRPPCPPRPIWVGNYHPWHSHPWARLCGQPYDHRSDTYKSHTTLQDMRTTQHRQRIPIFTPKSAQSPHTTTLPPTKRYFRTRSVRRYARNTPNPKPPSPTTLHWYSPSTRRGETYKE